MADAYGWSKRQILEEVYPDELPLLLRRIQRRQLLEEQRRIVDKLHLIEIVTLPYRDPKKGQSRLPRELQTQLRRIDDLLHPDRGKHFDQAAFDRLVALKAQVDAIRR